MLADIGLACLAVFFIGLSYGAIAVASGFPLWVPAAQSVLVLAGASEFLFVGIVAAGGSPIAAALAGLLVNSRHLPYGLALPTRRNRPGLAAAARHAHDERRERGLRPGPAGSAGASAPPTGPAASACWSAGPAAR